MIHRAAGGKKIIDAIVNSLREFCGFLVLADELPAFICSAVENMHLFKLLENVAQCCRLALEVSHDLSGNVLRNVVSLCLDKVHCCEEPRISIVEKAEQRLRFFPKRFNILFEAIPDCLHFLQCGSA